MKRIIALHISEFGGHKQASSNIKQALEAGSPPVKVQTINGFGYSFPRAEKVVNCLYYTTIKHFPFLWGCLYDRKKIIKTVNPLKIGVNKIAFKKFSRLIRANNPDAMIATQAFPCGLAADFKKYYNLDFPLFAVVTDYYPHRFWLHQEINYYIVASKDARDALVKEGVEENKIKILGIPVSLNFLKRYSVGEIAHDFGFQQDKKTILIMGGGSGLGPIKDLVKALGGLNSDFQIIVVCGNNKKLHEWIQKRKNTFSKNIYCFGYVDYINKLMDFADILITKAGGITVSEALTKELAIITTASIPGQEEKNVHYLKNKGSILEAKNKEELLRLTRELLDNPDYMDHLKRAAKEISRADSSLEIANLVRKAIF
jgi:processive 1,2-diacylglycerol beta-glucosyltransferase